MGKAQRAFGRLRKRQIIQEVKRSMDEMKKNGGGVMPGLTSPVKPSPSTIEIIFTGVGMADFQVVIGQVSAGQMLAAAGYLKWLAEKQLDRITANQPRIVVPERP